jgi:hypothetical protein
MQHRIVAGKPDSGASDPRARLTPCICSSRTRASVQQARQSGDAVRCHGILPAASSGSCAPPDADGGRGAICPLARARACRAHTRQRFSLPLAPLSLRRILSDLHFWIDRRHCERKPRRAWDGAVRIIGALLVFEERACNPKAKVSPSLPGRIPSARLRSRPIQRLARFS